MKFLKVSLVVAVAGAVFFENASCQQKQHDTEVTYISEAKEILDNVDISQLYDDLEKNEPQSTMDTFEDLPTAESQDGGMNKNDFEINKSDEGSEPKSVEGFKTIEIEAIVDEFSKEEAKENSDNEPQKKVLTKRTRKPTKIRTDVSKSHHADQKKNLSLLHLSSKKTTSENDMESDLHPTPGLENVKNAKNEDIAALVQELDDKNEAFKSENSNLISQLNLMKLQNEILEQELKKTEDLKKENEELKIKLKNTSLVSPSIKELEGKLNENQIKIAQLIDELSVGKKAEETLQERLNSVQKNFDNENITRLEEKAIHEAKLQELKTSYDQSKESFETLISKLNEESKSLQSTIATLTADKEAQNQRIKELTEELTKAREDLAKALPPVAPTDKVKDTSTVPEQQNANNQKNNDKDWTTEAEQQEANDKKDEPKAGMYQKAANFIKGYF